MRKSALTALVLMSMAVQVSGAFAQGAPAAPSIPRVPAEVKSATVMGYSAGELITVSAGALAGAVVGRMVFAGQIIPIVTGVAGGYLGYIWYNRY